MSDELSKIEQYYHEGRRFWSTNPAMIRSRQFYEMWEDAHQPHAWKLSANRITLVGVAVSLPRSDDARTAFIHWDAHHDCAAVTIEDTNGDILLLLRFDEQGAPVIEKKRGAAVADTSQGEMIEVLFEVLARTQRTEPGITLTACTKKKLIDCAVELELSDCYAAALTRLRKMKASEIKAMVRKALSDVPDDEHTAQLVLPLDGSYASTTGAISRGEEREPPALTIPARTRWAILRDLELLQKAVRMTADAEKNLRLPMTEARVLGASQGQETPVRLPTLGHVPISEGDLLYVTVDGEKHALGSFVVDVNDNGALYGRLRLKEEGAEPDATLFNMAILRPRKSPHHFLALAMEELATAFRHDASTLMGVTPVLLGLRQAGFRRAFSSEAPDRLDASQRQTWSAACDPDNPLVLIQGPPGTGKTTLIVAMLQHLIAQGQRVLITAPSNTAIDTICRKLIGSTELFRVGQYEGSIDPVVAETCWVGKADRREKLQAMLTDPEQSMLCAGTQVGLLRSEVTRRILRDDQPFDVILFDEAGMARMEEVLLCAKLAERAVLVGDPQQLPPFPLPPSIISELALSEGGLPRAQRRLLQESAMQWLARSRGFPISLIKRSYRCQNPRLLRFCSTFFYDAHVLPNQHAEYYTLSYNDRQTRYPPSSLCLYTTSGLPAATRAERLVVEGNKPGIENPLEAALCLHLIGEALKRHGLDEIMVITPYRRQVRLIRQRLEQAFKQGQDTWGGYDEEHWCAFVNARVATVDSFQGGESDFVLLSCVRSNTNNGIGFVDHPNRINVAYTRARREMAVVGDMVCLKKQAHNDLFERMERAIIRDGEQVKLTQAWLKRQGIDVVRQDENR